MDRETKKCPYCGEEILVVAKKCKHCGEWLDNKKQVPCPVCGEPVPEDIDRCPHCNELIKAVKDVPAESRSSKTGTNNFLYCKTCNARLNEDAGICPQCGDKDPYFLQMIRSYNDIAKWLFYFIVLIIITLPIVISMYSHTFTIGWLIFCILLWIVFFFAMRSLSCAAADKAYRQMVDVFRSVNDDRAMELWKSKMVNERGFFTNLFGYFKFGKS